MTLSARRLGLALIATLVAIATVVAGGTAARAATSPPWEPDADSVGALAFFDSAGQQVYGGTVDEPIAAYVEGAAAPRSGDTNATLYGYVPAQNSQGQPTDPGLWHGEQLTASTAYPNSSAPRTLATDPHPIVTVGGNDKTVGDLTADFPQQGTGAYSDVYQLRIYTSAAGESRSVKYDAADIQVTGTTWQVVYPASNATPTTTSLAVSPGSPAYHSTAVTLTATVNPGSVPGSVKFIDGSKTLATVAVNSGSARLVTKSLTDGTHRFAAEFVPSDPGTYQVSASSVTSYLVKPHRTVTSLSVSKKTVRRGQALTLFGKEIPAVAGKIVFRNGRKSLRSVKVSGGKAKLVTKKLSKGKHKLTARFVATDSQTYASSTSSPVTVTVK